MTKALVSPSSLSIAADLVLVQTPPTGANPEGPPNCARVSHTVASQPVLSKYVRNHKFLYAYNIFMNNSSSLKLIFYNYDNKIFYFHSIK